MGILLAHTGTIGCIVSLELGDMICAYDHLITYTVKYMNTAETLAVAYKTNACKLSSPNQHT